jgi:tetratricopeptide (TPR) repeat protein
MKVVRSRARRRGDGSPARWLWAVCAAALWLGPGAGHAETSGPALAWRDEAQRRYQSGNLPGALEALERAVRIAPDDAQLEFMRANALFRLNRNAEAARAYDRAGLLRSVHPDTWIGAGFAWFYAGEPDTAVAAFEKAVRQSPASTLARLALACGYHATGEPYFARLQLDLATEMEPGCDAPERLMLDVRWRPAAVAVLAGIPPLPAEAP